MVSQETIVKHAAASRLDRHGPPAPDASPPGDPRPQRERQMSCSTARLARVALACLRRPALWREREPRALLPEMASSTRARLRVLPAARFEHPRPDSRARSSSAPTRSPSHRFAVHRASRCRPKSPPACPSIDRRHPRVEREGEQSSTTLPNVTKSACGGIAEKPFLGSGTVAPSRSPVDPPSTARPPTVRTVRLQPSTHMDEKSTAPTSIGSSGPAITKNGLPP